jgi:hypothetical protein
MCRIVEREAEEQFQREYKMLLALDDLVKALSRENEEIKMQLEGVKSRLDYLEGRA